MKVSNTELQYLGYTNTHQLWSDTAVLGLSQIKLDKKPTIPYTAEETTKLRLGKRIEHFVSHELKQHDNIEIIAENIQVRKNKITLGEIDAIIRQNEEVIHLEIAYKFYLFDANVGATELEHWIGPNRKDSLVEKITKLKNKQLPLLYNPETQAILAELDLKVDKIRQLVCFKAQLFVPYNVKKQECKLINNNCIEGFYITRIQLKEFTNYSFYLPKKTDWTIQPHENIDWSSYSDFVNLIEPQLITSRAPLCWIKSPDRILKKCFVVWW